MANCFNNYQLELSKRINHDLESRKLELENLTQKQSSNTSDHDLEIAKLQNLDELILATYNTIEAIIDG